MKDFCIEALHKNEVAQEMKKRDIEQMEAKIADLTATIDSLAKAIAALQAEIAEMQVQLKRAGEDRELENKDFQQVVADQRETQRLLTNALNVLKGFYDKAFVQTKQGQPAGPPAPVGLWGCSSRSSRRRRPWRRMPSRPRPTRRRPPLRRTRCRRRRRSPRRSTSSRSS